MHLTAYDEAHSQQTEDVRVTAKDLQSEYSVLTAIKNKTLASEAAIYGYYGNPC